ncbi:DUF2207 domain-containing protein [Spirillospora sp. NBC_01491]|uniref:DUF2207 domain-containing protein n=1 Tax=Spirillospora sp. NBC_01491 TaxID=2976007 RepID=UPI002E37BF2C|nr:DUF2207 domain-containing protein [Spirillospora sp. NBC_01491]
MPDVHAWARGRMVAALALIAVLGLPGPSAAASEERVPALDVVLTISPDGTLRVRETITYDFAPGGGHGLVRRVRYRHGDRLYGISDIRTSSSTGAPARARTLKLLHEVQISVGDRNRAVHGRQAYVIEYDVGGAFTPLRGRDELVWDAVGTGWEVPIGEAAVRVEAPVPLRKVSCRAGRRHETTPCLRDRDGPYAVDFTQRGLRPREGMTVRVRLPKGAITVQRPRYAPPRWAGTWPGTAVLALALGSLALTARRPARRSAGVRLVGAGTLLLAADAADDVLARGLWDFALGDLVLAGLALIIAGAGVLAAHRRGPDRDRNFRTPQDGAGARREE